MNNIGAQRMTLNIDQASDRGGYLGTEKLSNGRIKIIGSAVTVISGTLNL